ncbi:MAG: glycosyltransferase family 2 protein [Proteobacteria bacterium]|nr:glycosyltransferase family 2 protein [Pseudomonadota bacterium]
MTVKTFHQRLSGHLFPKAWQPLVAFDVATDTPFVLDIVPIGDFLHVYISARVLFDDLQERLTFLEGQDDLPIEIMRPVPRGLDITLARKDAHKAQNIAIKLDGVPVEFDIVPHLTAHFEGLNTAFLTEVDPNPDTFKNWLAYHCDTQGLEAVVLLRRCGKKWPGKASVNRLVKAAEAVDGLKVFALLDSDQPLGHPKSPGLQDRHTTPDGPGKALLGAAIPAPYASALYELAILDAARRRCFDSARAVVHMGVCDLLLHGAGGQSVFDAAVASETYLKFSGVLAYPFSYRKPKKPHFADHTCTSFDGRRGPYIWAISRAFMARDPALRPFRASTVAPDPISESFSYWRCVGLCYPDLKIGQIVPKASLVLNEGLCAVLADQFDHAPKRPPEVAKSHKTSTDNKRIVVVTTMKNEGPFILEWLAYHMSIGVTGFVVYTNDCTDGTDTMFDLLAAKGIVDHRENPYRETGQKPQHAAYLAAQTTPKAEEADWIICMDVDEYINVHVGDGTLHDLFAAVPEANIWSMTWRLFGNAEVDLFADKFITEQFFRCAPQLCRKPHQAWGFKAMFRNNGYYKKFGVHRPVGLQPEFKDHIHWVNGSGVQMPEDILRTGWRNTVRSYGYDLVTLNHYALRSCESFLVKRDRGRVNHVDRDQGMTYWFRMNNNAQEDRTILPKLTRAKEKFAELMADDEIAAQHELCVKAHKKRIVELKERPDYIAMYETLKSERLVKLSRLHAHFGGAVFLAGPDSIPLDYPLVDEVEL